MLDGRRMFSKRLPPSDDLRRSCNESEQSKLFWLFINTTNHTVTHGMAWHVVSLHQFFKKQETVHGVSRAVAITPSFSLEKERAVLYVSRESSLSSFRLSFRQYNSVVPWLKVDGLVFKNVRDKKFMPKRHPAASISSFSGTPTPTDTYKHKP